MELILIWSCLAPIACSETAKAYAHYNPVVINYGHNVQKQAEKYAGSLIVQTFIPFVAAVSQNKAELIINSNFKIQLSNYSTKLTFNKTF